MRASSEDGGSDPARKQWAARMAFTAGTWIEEARIRHSQALCGWIDGQARLHGFGVAGLRSESGRE